MLLTPESRRLAISLISLSGSLSKMLRVLQLAYLLWTTAFLTFASVENANVSISFSAFSMKEMSLANGGSLRSIVSFSYLPFPPSALEIICRTHTKWVLLRAFRNALRPSSLRNSAVPKLILIVLASLFIVFPPKNNFFLRI